MSRSKKRDRGGNDDGVKDMCKMLKGELKRGMSVNAGNYEGMGRSHSPRLADLYTNLPLLRILFANCPRLRPPFQALKNVFIQVDRFKLYLHYERLLCNASYNIMLGC